MWSAGIAFSPDGRQFSISNATAGIHTLDTKNWQEKWDYTFTPNLTMISLVYSPDGKYLVGCGRDYRIWFWDAATGDVAKTFVGPSNAQDLAFCDDGSRLITAPGILWDMSTGSQLLKLDGGGNVVAISPDGRQIATGGSEIFIW
jgi:WD40 repeat protein